MIKEEGRAAGGESDTFLVERNTSPRPSPPGRGGKAPSILPGLCILASGGFHTGSEASAQAPSGCLANFPAGFWSAFLSQQKSWNKTFNLFWATWKNKNSAAQPTSRLAQKPLIMQDYLFSADQLTAMDEKTDIKQDIRRLMVENLMLQITPEEIGDDQSLFGPGSVGLDSVDALQLVVALDKTYGLKIGDPEAARQILQNVNSIAAAILKHQAGSKA
jgi:acyl carrier protein